MDAVEQAILDFPFYTLQQCTHQQLISHSKNPVNIYHHTQTNEIFVVKEIPYNQKIIRFYSILMYHDTLNIIPARGLSLLKIINKSQKLQKRVSKNNLELKQRNQSKFGNKYILIWMQKFQMSLPEYVQQRRKKRKPFSSQEVRDFIFQLVTTLAILQTKGICHRDIKPQNILYHKGRYFLCDFDQVILTKQGKNQKTFQEIQRQLEYTTILYSTPKFLKALKNNTFKDKYFDPYKMDVYSFGLTLLYFCSLGKFCIDDRHIYIYSQDGSHTQFIDEERRKFIKKDPQLKAFNNFIKLMLEQDEYKRDDFITLNIKIKNLLGLDEQSEHSNSQHSKKFRRQDRQKVRKSHGKGFIFGKFKKSQKFLIYVFLVVFLIYIFLLIF